MITPAIARNIPNNLVTCPILTTDQGLSTMDIPIKNPIAPTAMRTTPIINNPLFVTFSPYRFKTTSSYKSIP